VGSSTPVDVWVRVKPPPLSERIVGSSLTLKVNVGSSSENGPKPNMARAVEGRVKVVGGLLLPSPFATFGANSCSSPTPLMLKTKDPNV
jgi:hypothetical protein